MKKWKNSPKSRIVRKKQWGACMENMVNHKLERDRTGDRPSEGESTRNYRPNIIDSRCLVWSEIYSRKFSGHPQCDNTVSPFEVDATKRQHTAENQPTEAPADLKIE